MLTNSYKALHLTKKDFFPTQLPSTVITKYGNGAVVQIATVFEPVYYVACQRVSLNRDFLDIYLTTFFRSA